MIPFVVVERNVHLNWIKYRKLKILNNFKFDYIKNIELLKYNISVLCAATFTLYPFFIY